MADLRTVLVDDEQLARDELGFLLGQLGGIEVIAQAGNGVEALSTIDRLQPDLVFLDVQMPGLTGFEVARRLLETRAPSHIIFVTAYDQHAIEAFVVNAVDYLLKPVEQTRLQVAIDRARRRISVERVLDRGTSSVNTDQLEKIVQLVSERQSRRERLAIKIGERFMLVQAEDVLYASLRDDGIAVVTEQHAGTSNYRTLDELQDRLDPSVFWRVHRSHLVNINKIKEIVPWFSRNYILRMKDAKSTEIPMTSPGIGIAQVKEELVAWVKTLVSAAVYAILIVTFGVQVARVEGQSMAPTLEDQDRLIVNKLVYRIGEPRRGDIVMLYYPLNPEKSFVKRVIAEEGDTVRIVDGRVYVNDIPLKDDYVPSEFRSHDDWGPQVIPEGYYFVMGDHRNNSSDSRHWGMVPKKYIIGKVQIRWWPVPTARVF